jgi:Tn3 transposase DDE domain
MDAAISKLQATGEKIKPEDLARLSPLVYQHINMLGRYSFALPESVQKGELRSFHKPFSEAVFEDFF